jgi:hypothetical protein
MDQDTIKTKLMEVLQNIQTLSGEACPALKGSTRPADELPEFTSKIWPVAAGMLGAAIGKQLPCEENIFVNQDTKQPHSIDQTVALVCKIVAKLDEEHVSEHA